MRMHGVMHGRYKYKDVGQSLSNWLCGRFTEFFLGGGGGLFCFLFPLYSPFSLHIWGKYAGLMFAWSQ